MTADRARHPVLLAWVPTARTLPVVGPAALAAAAIGLMAFTYLEREAGEQAAPMVVRVALLLTATLVAWAFEDPSDAMVTPTPLGRVRLRVIRALTALLPWAIVLGLVLAMAGEPQGPQRYLVEGTAMALWALGLAGAAARFGSAEPSRVAMGTLMPLVGVSLALVPQRILWGEPAMTGVPARWWLVLFGIGSVVSLVAVAGPEPLRSPAPRRSRSRTSGSGYLDVAVERVLVEDPPGARPEGPSR